MTLVTLLSTLAMVLGLGGILPQLGRMLRSRSAGGQAPLGWGMGLAANSSMAYVNFTAYDASLIGTSNLMSATLCGCAIALIGWLGRRPAAPLAPAFAFDDMPTQEFAALRAAVLARDPRPRTCRSPQARRGSGRARTTRAAAPTTRA